ncbi:MAG TPA: type II and III secretion system protein family protein [Acidobacteriota bacterium]|nr:type II and III secretion system protein family protein [Acidobacteriota bacterium]
MNYLRGLLGLFLGVLICSALVPEWAKASSTPAQAALGASVVSGAAATQAPQQGGHLRVLWGKSLVINSPEPLKRVSVTDPKIASAIIISDRQVLIHGQSPGVVTFMLWNEEDQAQSFDLKVELDLASLREMLGKILPDEPIQVRQSGDSVVLTGMVDSEASLTQAEALSTTVAPSVVNLLGVEAKHEVVMLKVRMAEVDRALLKEYGANFFSQGFGNTIGAVSTRQFNSVSSVDQGNSTVSDLLNIFIFRPDLDLGMVLRALEQNNVAQLLAEPNIMALDGTEASFLAGGEFPFPVVQGGSNFSSVTIQFREFGVRLNFTPEVLDENRIRLKVAPEVSALDYSNALTVSGFVVPAISTRRAETELELANGQSFAIAGLIDQRFIQVASKIPLLGDIPFIGNLFRSKSIDKNNAELLVTVTPQLVSTMTEDEFSDDVVFPEEWLPMGVPEATAPDSGSGGK